MVIGILTKLRGFKTINLNLLPAYYINENKAWIDPQLFKMQFHQQFIPTVKIYSKQNNQRGYIVIIDT